MSDKKQKRRLQQGVKEPGSKMLRVRLYEDELEELNNWRSLYNQSIESGQNPQDVKHGWVKTKEHSLFVTNPNYKGILDSQNEFKKSLIEELKNYAPKFHKIKREKIKDGHLLVIDPADVHIGKLCSEFETGKKYNSQIAAQRVLDGVDGILNKSNGFNIDKINLILGNDILHVDNPNNTTTSGTRQDIDGMFYDNFLMAKRLYIDVIEKLLNIADVHCTYNPSNHDYMSGWLLAEIIQTHFSNSKNITFDCSISHRKYFVYGTNLIGTTHGDGAKQVDLGALMSVEAKEHWAKSEHRYFYTHHIHHKSSKEYIHVMIESLRSPSPADSWHHRNGYINNPAIEGFIHHKKHGQIARLTHYF